MFNEALRMHTAWLKHETHGVNAMLALVPRYLGEDDLEEAPAVPDVALITDETVNTKVAMGLVPKELPALLLTLDIGDAAEDQQAEDMGDGQFGVILRYCVKEEHAAVATRWAGYTLRATVWSLRRLYQEMVSGASEAREANGVQLIRAGKILWEPRYQPVGDGHVSGALKITIDYRDTGLILVPAP